MFYAPLTGCLLQECQVIMKGICSKKKHFHLSKLHYTTLQFGGPIRRQNIMVFNDNKKLMHFNRLHDLNILFLLSGRDGDDEKDFLHRPVYLPMHSPAFHAAVWEKMLCCSQGSIRHFVHTSGHSQRTTFNLTLLNEVRCEWIFPFAAPI